MTEALPSVAVSTARRTERARVHVVKFGDGYEQRTPDGINSVVRTYELGWNAITKADANTLDAFFRARQGTEAFTWAPPESPNPLLDRSKWVCERYQRSNTAEPITDYQATLQEFFG